MRSYSGHGFDAALVLAITFLRTVLSACQTGPPAPTRTPFAQTRWNQATLTPNPAHAHFTPTPTRPSMREQKEALASETDQAIAKFTQAIEDDRTDVGAYSDRGEAYAQQGELDAEYAVAYYNRGVAFQSSDKRKEAAADYKEYLRLEPYAPQKSRLKQQIQMFGG